MRAVSLWSGGKDSCLACYKAKAGGHDIVKILNFTDDTETGSLSHGLSAAIVGRQAGLTGMPFFQKSMPKEGYRVEFKRLMEERKRDDGIEAIVFGDIYLESHKEWIDGVCGELGVVPLLPLWGKDTTVLIDEFIGLGFRAIIVATRADKLGQEWLGREIDGGLMKELKEMGGIDPCGENGEFHTFVYGGPLFKETVRFSKGNKALRQGRWFMEVL